MYSFNNIEDLNKALETFAEKRLRALNVSAKFHRGSLFGKVTEKFYALVDTEYRERFVK
jgi:hypothetical protein